MIIVILFPVDDLVDVIIAFLFTMFHFSFNHNNVITSSLESPFSSTSGGDELFIHSSQTS